MIFYIVGDLVGLIDRTLVFKDDLIASALQTLLDIKKIHKKRKKEEKAKKSTKDKKESTSLNSTKSKKKSKPARRNKNILDKEDQIVFVGIHSRLVYYLFWSPLYYALQFNF